MIAVVLFLALGFRCLKAGVFYYIFGVAPLHNLVGPLRSAEYLAIGLLLAVLIVKRKDLRAALAKGRLRKTKNR